MQIGLLTLDGRGRIASFNAAAEQILGYSAREVLGRPGEEILDGAPSVKRVAGRSAFVAQAGRGPQQSATGALLRGWPLPPTGLGSRLPAGTPEEQFKRNARHKDGRIVPLVVAPYAAPGDNGPSDRPDPRPCPEDSAGNGVILVFQDERQLEKMENQLRHLDRLRSLDEFAAGIVHEIRNPLASISVNAQYILDQLEKHCRGLCAKRDRQGGERAGSFREEMQDILADVQSIESIVKRVLDFAHPNRPQVRDEPVADIVREVLRFSKMQLRQRGIRLVVDLGTQAKVRVDVSQVKQVLFNIVRNACDAMPRGGELRVSAARLPAETSGRRRGSLYERRALVRTPAGAPKPRAADPAGSTTLSGGRGLDGNGHVRIDMEDTGPGIPEEYLDRIFDPFFSLGHEGTGLGLAISRKIIENHGGRIEVASRPGEGARFGIVLPALPAS